MEEQALRGGRPVVGGPWEMVMVSAEAMECEVAMSRGATARGRRSGDPRVVLASRSPRRQALLREAGIDHEPSHPGFEDGTLRPAQASPAEWVMSLACLKAWVKAREAGPDAIVIGADTACVIDGELVGTPADAAEATDMLARFAGRSHEVVTGVAVIDTRTGARRLFADQATVTMGPLSDEMIADYVASGAWQGKAGAYNLSERIEAGWPIVYEGDPGTIMGLPVAGVRRAIDSLVEARA